MRCNVFTLSLEVSLCFSLVSIPIYQPDSVHKLGLFNQSIILGLL